MSILLEAEHLTKTFTQRGKNPFKAVKDVSFTLKKGETLGIVGESGSGKSTIAKLLTRLTDITEGTLKFEGKDITRLKQSQLKEVYGDIQMVFQQISVYRQDGAGFLFAVKSLLSWHPLHIDRYCCTYAKFP